MMTSKIWYIYARKENVSNGIEGYQNKERKGATNVSISTKN